jgi:hypothetical protein
MIKKIIKSIIEIRTSLDLILSGLRVIGTLSLTH